MGRPNYEDSAAGGDDQQPATTESDTTGWLQHGQDPESLERRGT